MGRRGNERSVRSEQGVGFKSLQCHRTSADNRSKDNVFVQQKTGLTARDKIISIYHKVREAEVKSRIQITVQEDYAGMALYDSMRGWVSSCSAVSKWKVMNPLLGSSGPDSAIVYLNRPLEDETVAAFVCVAVKKLGNMIEALSSTPLGLKKVAAGMYGADIPPETSQRNKLKMSGDFNSAGGIMASIICKAAWHAAAKLAKEPAKAARFGGEENYLRAILKEVLQDMGWSLV